MNNENIRIDWKSVLFINVHVIVISLVLVCFTVNNCNDEEKNRQSKYVILRYLVSLEYISYVTVKRCTRLL